MPQAQITINAVIGSNTDLPINTIVSLDNNNIGGEVSFLWEILDQPAGTADLLSSATIQAPTFTPKKEGTYLIRLTVNQGLPDEDIDSVVAAVLQLKTRKRVPAAGEQTEASTSRGWAVDTNDGLRFFHDSISDPGTIVGVNGDASPMTRGDVVRATSAQTIKSGLPGQEDLPGFTPAPATIAGNTDELLLVLEGDIDGGATVAVGGLGVFRFIGRLATLALGAGAVGDSVFLSDTATISTTPGTNRRQVGSIMAVNGVNRDIWFAGTQGGDNAPIDPPYVVFGSPGILPNANRIDGLNATGAINNIPYTFRAADVTTPALVAKRFSAAGADPFQVHDEIGTVLAKVDAAGVYRSADIVLTDTLTSVDAVLTGGLIVGFSGTPVADEVQVGDADFRLDHTASGVPRLVFASTSDITFDRTGGASSLGRMVWTIAGSTVAALDTAGLQVNDGLIVGFAGTPVADEIQIGDVDFKIDHSVLNSPSLVFDAANFADVIYTRMGGANSLGRWRWRVSGGVGILDFDSAGLQVFSGKGLAVGNPPSAPNDILIASGGLSLNRIDDPEPGTIKWDDITPPPASAGVMFVDDTTGKMQLHTLVDFDRYVPQSFVAIVSSDVSDTTAVTAFSEKYSIPLNTLKVGSTIRVKAWGRHVNNVGGGSINFTLLIGGTTIVFTSGRTLSLFETFSIESWMTVRTAGAGGTLATYAKAVHGVENSTAVGAIDVTHAELEPGINTTSAQLVHVFADMSVADVNNIVRLQGLIVDVT